MRRLAASLVPQYPLQEPLAGWPTCAHAPVDKAAATISPRKHDRVMTCSAPFAGENPRRKYSTETTRHPDNISERTRVSARLRGKGGTAGTDSAGKSGMRAVLTSSSVMEWRRARGAARNCSTERLKRWLRRWEPLTPRHALRHLTTLSPSRLHGAWLTVPAVGESRSSAVTSAGRKRRISRIRLGAMAETRVIRGEGIQYSFRSGRGSLCTVI